MGNAQNKQREIIRSSGFRVRQIRHAYVCVRCTGWFLGPWQDEGEEPDQHVPCSLCDAGWTNGPHGPGLYVVQEAGERLLVEVDRMHECTELTPDGLRKAERHSPSDYSGPWLATHGEVP